jgi:hypothetical protein
MTAHYEVEVPGHEPDFGNGWQPVRVFRADGFTTPLTFASLDEARAYVAKRDREMRVVLVTDEGDREVVGPSPA